MPDIAEELLESVDDMENIKAIAVPIGPGHEQILQIGVDLAIALGKEHNLPVIPVNISEAQLFAHRIHSQKRSKYPFLSFLSSSNQTEIVLTNGVGLHTLFGITLDQTLARTIDRVSIELR